MILWLLLNRTIQFLEIFYGQRNTNTRSESFSYFYNLFLHFFVLLWNFQLFFYIFLLQLLQWEHLFYYLFFSYAAFETETNRKMYFKKKSKEIRCTFLYIPILWRCSEKLFACTQPKRFVFVIFIAFFCTSFKLIFFSL